VKEKTAVFELGYQNTVYGTAEAGFTQSQVPQTFARLGIEPRFEVDVIGPNYEATHRYASGATPTLTNGVADSGLGFKYELPPAEAGPSRSMASIPDLTARRFSRPETQPKPGISIRRTR
jgi:hypothetical protein